MLGQGPKEQEFRSPANAARRRRPQKPWYSRERSPAHMRPALRREVQEQSEVQIDNALAFRRTGTLACPAFIYNEINPTAEQQSAQT
jgi:hypothetical protein